MQDIVVFDLDGVLVDFVHGYSTVANMLFGYPVIFTFEQKHWKWSESQGYTNKQIDEIWRYIDSTRFWEHLLQLASPQDLRAMKDLAKLKKIIYCTNRRGDTAYEQSVIWLSQHDFPYGEVLVTDDKLFTLT